MGNVVLGSDGIAIRQGIYEQKSAQMTDLGRFIDFEDGRRFRYCKCNSSAGITIGYVCAAPGPDDQHVAIVQTNYGITAGAKDNISVAVTTAPAANQYADGLLVVSSGTGVGQSYRIKKNTAASPAKVWLYDEVITTVASTADITLMKNKYLDVVVAPSDVITTPIGVPLIGITEAYYFWAQTRGYVGIKADGTGTQPVVGDNVMMGTSGVVKVASGATDPVIGVCVYIPTFDEYCIVDLHLE